VEIDHHDIVRTEYLKHVQTESDEDHAQESIRKFFDEDNVHFPSPLSQHGSPEKGTSISGEENLPFSRNR
jgi:hypothetical protein